MKRIPLTQGQYALVDDEDYEWLNQWKWQAQKLTYGGFAATRWRRAGEADGPSIVYMHRVIANAPSGLDVDHRNHDTLDNRKMNLRIVTRSQNMYNRKPHGKTSNRKGVAWHPQAMRWVARIAAEGKQHYLGLFDTEDEAAQAYATAAQQYHGEYAYRG